MRVEKGRGARPTATTRFPRVLLLLLSVMLAPPPRVALGAELEPETVAVYERYVAAVRERFAAQRTGSLRLEIADPRVLAGLRAGRIVAAPVEGDGIIDVEGGLIHHWRGTAFVPGATLEEVLRVAQDYAAYHSTYDWILASAELGGEPTRSPDGERFQVFFRIERSASAVTSVVDVWADVEYWYPRADRAMAMSDADCIRQVENAGARDERRLPVGAGSGYLWRANTFSTYLQRDGGVYLEVETVGLSRGFPPLLGWLVEPIARRIGRGSAAESLEQLRDAVIGPAERARRPRQPAAAVPSFWCTAEESPAAARTR